MSFIKIPEEFFNKNLNPTQFKIICALVKFSFEDYKSYIGYDKLSEYCNIARYTVIRNMQQLAAAGYIKITPRGAFSRSNEITLNIDRLAAQPSNGGSGVEGSQNETATGSQNETEGSFKVTPHIDKRFKYQDLNLNTREQGSQNETPRIGEKEEKNIATGDDAPVRSMSEPGEPGGNQQRSEGGEFTAKDKQIARFLLKNNAHFNDWYRLSRSPNGEYFVNPITDFIGKIIPLSQRVVSAPEGVHVCNWAAPSNHIIINFQQLSKCI